MVKTGTDNQHGSNEEISQNPNITTKVFTTSLEKKYFNLFAKYRKDYADMILFSIDDKKDHNIEEEIQTLNTQLHKDLLKINDKNTSEYLHKVLLIFLDGDCLGEDDKMNINSDALFDCLMNEKYHIIPAKQLKHIIDLQDFINVLIGKNKK